MATRKPINVYEQEKREARSLQTTLMSDDSLKIKKRRRYGDVFDVSYT